METQIYFHHSKNIPNLQKNRLKQTKILQDMLELYNQSQISTQAKI
jgi:hypothetical protein